MIMTRCHQLCTFTLPHLFWRLSMCFILFLIESQANFIHSNLNWNSFIWLITQILKLLFGAKTHNQAQMHRIAANVVCQKEIVHMSSINYLQLNYSKKMNELPKKNAPCINHCSIWNWDEHILAHVSDNRCTIIRNVKLVLFAR